MGNIMSKICCNSCFFMKHHIKKNNTEVAIELIDMYLSESVDKTCCEEKKIDKKTS